MVTPRRLSYAALLAVSALALFAPDTSHAFRSTKQESYTDPDYKDYRPQNIVLHVSSDDFEVRNIIEQRLTKELAKYGIKVFLQNDLFSPTRQWSEEARNEVYTRESIDTGMIVTVGASASSVIPVAMQTFTSGSTSSSHVIVSAKSNASFGAVLLDLAKNRVAWYSDVYTKASGTIFVGSKRDAAAAVKGVIVGLREHGHIQPLANP